jgi:hypothetical protein
MADQTSDGADRGERNSLDLDALAVSDRFRLFNFTRRDDHVAYLWVLRALDRLRAVHQVQAHTDDVAAALAELERSWPGKPSLAPRRSSNLGACVPGDLNPYVSEGGLDPRSWWYIPKRGIHHHSKLTRQGPAGPAFRRRKEAAASACPTGCPGM